MAELQRELELLAAEWPETPPLRAAVVERLTDDAADPAASPPGAASPVPAASTRRARRLRALPRPLRIALIAALVLLLAAGTVLAASREAREFFGLQGATVERTSLPAPPLELQLLGLGRRVSVETALAAPFRVSIPRELGRPDVAFVLGEEVSFTYGPRDGLPEAEQLGLGLLITQVPGRLGQPAFGKLAPRSTRVEFVRVGRHRAIWIEGAPHFFGYRAPDGRFRQGSLRVAGNVLLVERGDVLVRLEGRLPRERAIEIAESLRP